MAAAHREHLAVVEALVNAEADIDATNEVWGICYLHSSLDYVVLQAWKHGFDVCCSWRLFVGCDVFAGERGSGYGGQQHGKAMSTCVSSSVWWYIRHS